MPELGSVRRQHDLVHEWNDAPNWALELDDHHCGSLVDHSWGRLRGLGMVRIGKVVAAFMLAAA